MALPVNVDDLINHRKVECARIEYKAGWNPEKVLHTLCAFANDIDNWGGGYVILDVAKNNKSPKPILETNTQRDYFTFVLPVHEMFLKADAEIVRELNPTDPVADSVADPVSDPVSDPVGDPVKNKCQTLLKALVDGPMSAAELREVLSVSHRKFFRDNYINPAIHAALIKPEDGVSPRNPRLRYFITKKGRGVVGDLRAGGVNRDGDAGGVNAHVGGFETVGKTVEVTVEKTVEKILAYLQVNPAATQKMIASAVGLSIRGVEWNLKTLKASGRIRRIGPDRGGHWEVVSG